MTTINPTAATAAAPPPATTAPGRPDQMGKDTFLKLLVAQLKYQNPMSPSDPNAFMAQTAQFSMVERMEEIAASERASAATALLGSDVTWGEQGVERHGVVTSVSLGGVPMLLVGDQKVPYSSVTRITAPASSTAPPTGTAGTTPAAPATTPAAPAPAAAPAATTADPVEPPASGEPIS